MSDIGNAFSDSLAGLSSLFSGGGGAGVAPTGSSDLGTAISQAAASSPAPAVTNTYFDPTGSIGAQLATTPPGQTDPVGSTGGTQSGGAPQPASSAGQGQGGGGQGPQAQSNTIRQILKNLLGGAQGQSAAGNPYETGAGAGRQQPPWFQPLESGPLPPRSVPAPESAGLPQSPLAPGETWPAEPANVPKSIQPGDEPPEASVPVPQQQDAVGGPDLGGLARAVLPRTVAGAAALPLGAAGAYFGSTSPTQEREPNVIPSEAGLAPPGTGEGSYPQSTTYPQGGPAQTQSVAQGLEQEGGQTGGMQPAAVAADPKTGLPRDPVTGGPVTPEQYRKWYNDQTKKAQAKPKSADPALEPTKPKLPTRKEGPPARQQPPPMGGPPGGPPPGMGMSNILRDVLGLASSPLGMLAMTALMGGMGGRRHHHHGGGRFRDGRFHENMGHFHPHFYRHDRDGGGGINPALMAMMMGGGQQQGQQGGPGQGRPGMRYYQNPQGPLPDGPGDPNGTVDQNSFMNTVAEIESGNRNDNPGDNGVARGYWNIQTPTWRDFAPQAGVDLNKWPTADAAPREVQAAVAALIPFYRWGPETQRKLIAKYGNLDPNAPLGQLAQRYGGTRYAMPASPPQPAPSSFPQDASAGVLT